MNLTLDGSVRNYIRIQIHHLISHESVGPVLPLVDVDVNLADKSFVVRVILEQELPPIGLGQHVLGNVVEFIFPTNSAPMFTTICPAVDRVNQRTTLW